MIKVIVIETVRYLKGYEVKDLKEAKNFIKKYKNYIGTIKLEVYDGDKLIHKTKKKP